MLIGAEFDAQPSYSRQSSFDALRGYAYKITRLLPFLRDMRILRTWAGICDISADYSPIMGATGVDGFLVTTGWGTWGFKAIPAGGEGMAELIATGRPSCAHRAVRARSRSGATTSWPTRARRGRADALARLPALRAPAARRVHVRWRAARRAGLDHRSGRARLRRGLGLREPRRRHHRALVPRRSAAGAG